MERPAFTADFERDNTQIVVTLTGRFTPEDGDRFRADADTAGGDRRREWLVDATELEPSPAAPLADLLLWLRTLGHVCLLNPPPDLRTAMAASDVHQAIVVRSDSRAQP